MAPSFSPANPHGAADHQLGTTGQGVEQGGATAPPCTPWRCPCFVPPDFSSMVLY